MRLVDQHHHPPALAVEPQKMLLQGAQHARRSVLFQPHLQLVADGKENLVARQGRIGEINGFNRRGQSFHEHPAQHRLAAADLSGDLDDAFVVGDGVEQRLERRAAVGALKEEIRVRGDAKGRLFQPEVV